MTIIIILCRRNQLYCDSSDNSTNCIDIECSICGTLYSTEQVCFNKFPHLMSTIIIEILDQGQISKEM